MHIVEILHLSKGVNLRLVNSRGKFLSRQQLFFKIDLDLSSFVVVDTKRAF